MTGFFGSSPLARGTLSGFPAPFFLTRLIPARAGNTPDCYPSRSPAPAHPRSRGEHKEHDIKEHAHRGSSPLARGTRLIVFPGYGVGRLIPARAGNTRFSAEALMKVPAHPRSRGEHLLRFGPEIFRAGSSPLARGTHIIRDLDTYATRLIPARAGNTAVLLQP